jgi:hypothetical protein
MTIRLTRRRMLASAAGGAAFSTGLCGIAPAQNAKRIEQFAPELDRIVSSSLSPCWKRESATATPTKQCAPPPPRRATGSSAITTPL